MKTPPLILSLALASLLPVTAWAEAPATGPADRSIGPPSKDAWPARSAAGDNDRPGADADRSQQQRSSAEYRRQEDQRLRQSRQSSEDTFTSLDASPQSAGSGQIQRVSSSDTERRVTATSLIGKKVLDREGQEIGKVKDVGITSAASHLRDPKMAGASTGTRMSRTDGQDPSQSTDPGRVNETRSLNPDRSGDGGLASTRSPGAAQSSASQANREPRLLIQAGRSLQTEGDLVSIPASQVSREGDDLRVDMSRDELRALVSRQQGISMSEE
jgi:hypothetical protein